MRRFLECVLVGGAVLTSLSCQDRIDTPTILIQSEESERWNRFNSSYQTGDVAIALHEGVLLRDWLNKNYPASTPEAKASRVNLHSRLSALFLEAGNPVEAQDEAMAAKRFFDLIITNVLLSSSVIVSNTLTRDRFPRGQRNDH